MPSRCNCPFMWAMLSSVDVSGMRAGLDRGVLGRQAERVPAERMQHVVAAHPLGARHHVADDVVADVADVRVPRRVGEHLEAVVLRPRRIDVDLERSATPSTAACHFLSSCWGLNSVIDRNLYSILPVRRGLQCPPERRWLDGEEQPCGTRADRRTGAGDGRSFGAGRRDGHRRRVEGDGRRHAEDRAVFGHRLRLRARPGAESELAVAEVHQQELHARRSTSRTPASRVDRVRVQGENPPRGGGQQPIVGEQPQSQTIIVDADHAVGAAARDLDDAARLPARGGGAATRRSRRRRSAARSTTSSRFVGDNKAKVNGYINDAESGRARRDLDRQPVPRRHAVRGDLQRLQGRRRRAVPDAHRPEAGRLSDLRPDAHRREGQRRR